MSTGRHYHLGHHCAHTGVRWVCFLWSFHSPLASKPLKTVLTWHTSPHWIVSHNNKSSNKLRAKRVRWRCPWSVTSKLCGSRLHHTWMKKRIRTLLLMEEVVKESSLCKFFLALLLQSTGELCVKLPFNPDLPISEGHKHVKKPARVDLQYRGKLCSICPSNSQSTATILQESLKAHYWQRDKAIKKNAPHIITKSRWTSIRLTGLKKTGSSWQLVGNWNCLCLVRNSPTLTERHWKWPWTILTLSLSPFFFSPSLFSGTVGKSSPWNKTWFELDDRNWSVRNMTVIQGQSYRWEMSCLVMRDTGPQEARQ